MNVSTSFLTYAPLNGGVLEGFKRFAFVEGRGGRSSSRKGVWIRGHLLDVGEDYLYGMWLRWKEFVEVANRLDAELSVGSMEVSELIVGFSKNVG